MSAYRLQYIIDSKGNILRSPIGEVTAYEENISEIQIITPFAGAISMGIEMYASLEERTIQHLALQPFKGQDVVSEKDPFYQEVYGWNVYSATIRQKVLQDISRTHSGRIGVSFTMRQRIESSNRAILFMGYFGLEDLPETGDVAGEYYVCDLWNYHYKNRVLTKGDIVYWTGSRWRIDKAFKVIANTETQTLPVNATVYAYEADPSLDESTAEILAIGLSDVQREIRAQAERIDNVPDFKHVIVTREEYDEIVESSLVDDNTEYTVLEEDEDSYSRYIGEIPLATGGGGGTGPGGMNIRITPEPITAPTNFSIPVGADEKFFFNYTHEEEAPATLKVISNGVLMETKTIVPGVGFISLKNAVGLGTNLITLEIEDYLEQKRRLNITVTGIEIELNSNYNEAQVNNGIVNFTYSLNVPGDEKTVFFQIGDEVHSTNVTAVNNIETFELMNGAHILKIWAQIRIGENTYNSPAKEFILLMDDGTYVGTMIASKFTTGEFEYGTRVNIDYVAYSPQNEVVNVQGIVNGRVVSDVNVTRQIQTWNVGILPVGTHNLALMTAVDNIEFTVVITESDSSVSAIDDATLRTYLTATAKSNSDLSRNEWLNSGKFGASYPFHMEGFNFASNGWINDALVFNGNAQATLEYFAFADEIQSDGRTIEIEFETPQIHDGTPLISSMNDGIGFEILGNRAYIHGSNARADVHYSEGTKIKLAFVISKIYNKVFIYLNGVLTGQNQITSATRFKQNSPAPMEFNPTLQGLKLYNIRVYNRELNSSELLSNYIFDIVDVEEKLDEFALTNIYDQVGNVSIERVKSLLPVMTITHPDELPSDPNYRPEVPTMTYENPHDETLNFTVRNANIRTQGTSTLIYPIKNFRIYAGSLTEEPVTLVHGSRPAHILNLKTDYVDSSVATNAVLAKLFEGMYSKGTPVMEEYPELGARTTIHGNPVALFHNNKGVITFVGLYSLNNDKSEPAIYGHGIAPYDRSHRYEIAYNVGESAGAFVKQDGISEEDWKTQIKNDFESIYPKGDSSDDNYASLKEFIEFIALNNIDTMDAGEFEAHKAEFAKRVDLEYVTKYFIVASMFGLLDSFGKNVQMNSWGDVDNNGFDKWYFTFYDLDTAIGLDNEGRILDENGDLIYDYNIELEHGEGFAQANSKFWRDFSILFADEIKAQYQDMRANYFTDDKIYKSFFDDHIEVIGPSIYNNSSFYKYVTASGSSEWEYMLNGNRELQIKSWVSNRLKFLDSKYVAGTNKSESMIGFRMKQEVGLPAELEITPHFHQYATVQYGAGHIPSNIVSKRTEALDPVVVKSPHTGETPFMECRVYGAENIAEIKGFTDMNVESIQLQYGVNLLKLDLGKSQPYSNLKSISLGNNKLLTELNLKNLIGLTAPLQISELSNLKKLDISGTNIKTVELPNGGVLEDLRISDVLTDLTLLNQSYLTEVNFTSLDDLRSLRIENTPVDVINLIDNAPELQFIRLMGIEFSTNDKQTLLDFADQIYSSDIGAHKYNGLDSDGRATDKPVIYGTFTLQSNEMFTEEELDFMELALPNVNIIQNSLGNFTFEDKGEYFEIKKYLGNESHVIIPEGYSSELDVEETILITTPITWKEIRGIGADGFRGNTSINTIEFGNTLEYIGESAFEDATSLYFTSMPSNIKRIDARAFRNNNVLDVVFLGPSVEEVGVRAFSSRTDRDLTIYVSHSSRPDSWDADWVDSNYTVIWGAAAQERQFVIRPNNGEEQAVVHGFLIGAEINRFAVKEHYIFDKWMHGDREITLPYIPSANDPSIIILDAIYIPIEYNITYSKLFGAQNDSNPETFTVEDLPVRLIDPNTLPSTAEAGYEITSFVGWYADENYLEEVIEITEPKDIELFAKWYPGVFNIYYKNYDENVEIIGPHEFNEKDLPILLPAPEGVPELIPEGHSFLGWVEELDSDDYITELTEGRMYTLYAKWGPDYVWLTDDDFSGETNGNFSYIPHKPFVIIPEYIKGVKLTNMNRFFENHTNRQIFGFKILNEQGDDASHNITSARSFLKSYASASHPSSPEVIKKIDLQYFNHSIVNDSEVFVYGHNHGTSPHNEIWEDLNLTESNVTWSSTVLNLTQFNKGVFFRNLTIQNYTQWKNSNWCRVGNLDIKNKEANSSINHLYRNSLAQKFVDAHLFNSRYESDYINYASGIYPDILTEKIDFKGIKMNTEVWLRFDNKIEDVDFSGADFSNTMEMMIFGIKSDLIVNGSFSPIKISLSLRETPITKNTKIDFSNSNLSRLSVFEIRGKVSDVSPNELIIPEANYKIPNLTYFYINGVIGNKIVLKDISNSQSSHFFLESSTFDYVEINNLKTSRGNLRSGFAGSKINSIVLRGWDTSADTITLTDLKDTGAEVVDLDQWKVGPNVKYHLKDSFFGIKFLNISGFDLTDNNVVSYSNMFNYPDESVIIVVKNNNVKQWLLNKAVEIRLGQATVLTRDEYISQQTGDE